MINNFKNEFVPTLLEVNSVAIDQSTVMEGVDKIVGLQDERGGFCPGA